MMLAVKPDFVKKHDQPEAAPVLSMPRLMSIGRYYDPRYTLDRIAPKGFVPYSEKATGEMLPDKSSAALSEEILKQIDE